MMAMKEVLRPMDKGHLTAGPAIVDILDGAPMGVDLDAHVSQERGSLFR
jgi:hypothetical protein